MKMTKLKKGLIKKEADPAIEEEGGGVAEGLLQVSEGFRHKEPAEV